MVQSKIGFSNGRVSQTQTICSLSGHVTSTHPKSEHGLVRISDVSGFRVFRFRTRTVFRSVMSLCFLDADEMLERRPFVVPRALGGGGGGQGKQPQSDDEEEEIEDNDNGKNRFDTGCCHSFLLLVENSLNIAVNSSV